MKFNDDKIESDLKYEQLVNPNYMNFELLKQSRFTIKLMGILLAISLGLNAIFIGGLIYLFSTYDISVTTTNTNENATFEGDFNNYNDNSSDNRVINDKEVK